MRTGSRSLNGLSSLEFNDTLRTRFFAKCGQMNSDGCIPWVGTKTKRGYGLIQAAGIRSRKTTAHRIAWVLANGDLAPGALVLHRCDNPSCVNVAHLFVGSQQENVDDMVSKGRHAWKDGQPWQKLNDSDVFRIIEMRRSGFTQQDVAESFGVSRSLISMVENCKVKHAAQVLSA